MIIGKKHASWFVWFWKFGMIEIRPKPNLLCTIDKHPLEFH